MMTGTQEDDVQLVTLPLPGGSTLTVTTELGPPPAGPSEAPAQRRPYQPQVLQIELRATGHWRAIVGALSRRTIKNMTGADVGPATDYDAMGAEVVTQRLTYRKKPRRRAVEEVVVWRSSRSGEIRAALTVLGPLTERQRSACSGYVRVYLRTLVARWKEGAKAA